MKMFCLVLVTFLLFPFYSSAEVPYAQRILLKAEFDRSEVTLQKQVDKIKRMRTNIGTGKGHFEEVRHWLEKVFVYSLETLHQSKKTDSFNRLVYILNNSQTRNQVYYPVRVSSGISKDTKFVAFADEDCINPVEKSKIRQGTIFDVNEAALSHLNIGDTAIDITLRGNPSKVIAHLPLPDDSEIAKIAASFKNLSTDLTEYYNCNYVNEFKRLEEENRKLLRRYGDLARMLNLETKDFSGEKREKTITEELNNLTSTLPKGTSPILAPKDEIKATQGATP